MPSDRTAHPLLGAESGKGSDFSIVSNQIGRRSVDYLATDPAVNMQDARTDECPIDDYDK